MDQSSWKKKWNAFWGNTVSYTGKVSGSTSGDLTSYLSESNNYVSYNALLGYFKKIWCPTKIVVQTQNKVVQVTPSLIGYTQQSSSGGRIFQIQGTDLAKYRYSVIDNVIKPYYNYAVSPDWYAPENMTSVAVNNYAYNPTMTPYSITSEDIIKNQQNMFVDKNNRYWIAIGPTIMNASYNPDGSIDPGSMKYGCKVDILLEHTITKQQVWMYCVIGDVKAHTFSGSVNGTYIDGKGVFQTGFTTDKTWAKGNMDASIIEFMGMGNTSSLKGLGNYSLSKIVVYD